VIARGKSRFELALHGLAALVLMLVVFALGPTGAKGFRAATGAFIPGVENDPTLIDAYAAKVGRSPLIVGAYRDWSRQPFDLPLLESVDLRGAVPVVTWEPWDEAEIGVPLRSIAHGDYDAYLTESALKAAAWGRPMFVRFAHEMNGDWYPWGLGVGGNTPGSFRTAWRHVVSLFRSAGADNVRWVWCPYVSNEHPGLLRRLFPGDRWVDWACLDGFNWGSYSVWQSFKAIFARSYQQLIRVTSRPLMLGEIGVNEAGGSKPDWISRTLQRALPRYRHVRALVWFDSADWRADFRVDSSVASLTAFRRALQLPVYGEGRKQLLATPSRIGSARHRKTGDGHRRRGRAGKRP